MLTDKNLSAIKKPIILTVHDMIFELFNEKLSFAEQHIKWKRDAILAADSIICVSHNTKADLLKYYPQVEKKINVIYEGSELKYENSFGPEDTPGNPYFIYVGSRAGYKNFDLLLYAFSELIKTYKNIFLCIVGPQLSVKEHKLISELGLENNIKCYDFVSSNHLAKLYRCSIALVYPSLYEGFGLPPLEAMTCGTSVITSNVSSIPEVVGDSCILINPELKSDMLESMAFLFRNESERKKLIEKGFVRSTLFDWNKNVAKIVELYKSYK